MVSINIAEEPVIDLLCMLELIVRTEVTQLGNLGGMGSTEFWSGSGSVATLNG